MPTSPDLPVPAVALLTGGRDRPYALGLASALISQRVPMDFIGSDDLDAADLRQSPGVNFLNLRGDQSPDAPILRKAARVLKYYARLIVYATWATPRVFHVLWNNKFEAFDRTVLLTYYRLLGKRLVLTVHNVNAGIRDHTDGVLNRFTLRIQYSLANHLFVHTDRMRQELHHDFGVPDKKITVIPFGINATVPNTRIGRDEARAHLGLLPNQKVILFFGNIAPYKGLEFLVRAMAIVRSSLPECRLVIAGRPKGSESYWSRVRQEIRSYGLEDSVVFRIEYVADAQVEIYFKAADVLVLPYTHVFQSGVLFLGYNFGLPAIVSDVGSLSDDVREGSTGLVCRPADPDGLARVIERFFASDMYGLIESRRAWIRRQASDRHSWEIVGTVTKQVYQRLAGSPITSSRAEGAGAA